MKRIIGIGVMAIALFAFVTPQRAEATGQTEKLLTRKFVDSKISGFYECDSVYIVGYHGPGGNPRELGPVYYRKDTTPYKTEGPRSFPKPKELFSTEIHQPVLGTIEYIHTGHQQRVFILTTQPVSMTRWFENTRLLIIEEWSKVDFHQTQGKKNGFILQKGKISEDKEVFKAARFEEMMSLYAQVADLDGYYGMSRLVNNVKSQNPNRSKDQLADAVIREYVTNTAAYSALAAAGPVWLLPANYAASFVQCMVKAQMAWALAYVYTGKKMDHEELMGDLLLLYSGDPNKILDAVVKGLDAADKALVGPVDTALGVGEIAVKTKLVQKLGKTKVATKVMDKAKPVVTSKITAKGIKAIPVISAVINAIISGSEATNFGITAKKYYKQ